MFETLDASLQVKILLLLVLPSGPVFGGKVTFQSRLKLQDKHPQKTDYQWSVITSILFEIVSIQNVYIQLKAHKPCVEAHFIYDAIKGRATLSQIRNEWTATGKRSTH